MLIVTLVLAVMLTGSVHLMMVSALVWVLSFLAQVTSVAVSALGKTQKRLYLYICIITGISITEVNFSEAVYARTIGLKKCI